MKEEIKKSFFRKSTGFFFRLTAFIFLLLLFLSMLAAYITPGFSIIPAYLSLGFTYLFFGSLIFYIIIFIKKYWLLFFIYSLVIVMGISRMSRYYQWGFTNELVPENTSVYKIMSFNVRLFNLYNWKNNKVLRDAMMNYLKKQNPDVLCLQEYYEDLNNDFETFSILTQQLGYKYHHRYFPVINKKVHRFGIATFSRYPIVGKKQIVFDKSSNMTLQSDIEFDSAHVVSVFNNHLESIRLSNEDVTYISDLEVSEETLEKGKGILSRLRRAFRERQSQSDIVRNAIDETNYPTIVCGDFNDIPVSYCYRKIRGDLYDSFVESGKGSGGTYSGKIPSFRIDYIFYSEQFNSYQTQIDTVSLSDHFPVITHLAFKE